MHTHMHTLEILFSTIILEVGHYSKQVTDLSEFHANTMTPNDDDIHHGGQSSRWTKLIDSFIQFPTTYTSIYNK
jgi:hypothetical protein